MTEASVPKHRYVTLERGTADYDLYMSGRFSSSDLAIPVPLLAGTNAHDNTTFQILSRREIARPSLATVLFQLLRFDLIGLTLVPALIVWLFVSGPVLSVVVLMASLACVHAATFAFNDYFDHMRGRDRLSEVSGSRVIQNGYLKAHEVLKIGFGFAFLASFGALYFTLQNTEILYFALLGLALFSLGTLYTRFGLKSSGFGDLAVFLGLGPIHTLAVQFALVQKTTAFIGLIGLMYGLLALVYVQSKSLVTSMVDHQAGVRTMAVRFSFDRMKTILLVELFVMVGLAIVIEPIVSVAFVVFVAGPFWLAHLVRQLRSPVSSRTKDLSAQILVVHALWSLSLLLHFVLSL